MLWNFSLGYNKLECFSTAFFRLVWCLRFSPDPTSCLYFKHITTVNDNRKWHNNYEHDYNGNWWLYCTQITMVVMIVNTSWAMLLIVASLMIIMRIIICWEHHRGKYRWTVDLLFDWFEISCMTTDNFCFYLQNRQIQTSQTGGQPYNDTSPFSISCNIFIVETTEWTSVDLWWQKFLDKQ